MHSVLQWIKNHCEDRTSSASVQHTIDRKTWRLPTSYPQRSQSLLYQKISMSQWVYDSCSTTFTNLFFLFKPGFRRSARNYPPSTKSVAELLVHWKALPLILEDRSSMQIQWSAMDMRSKKEVQTRLPSWWFAFGVIGSANRFWNWKNLELKRQIGIKTVDNHPFSWRIWEGRQSTMFSS